MKTVEFNINYGGFIGSDENYSIEVPDDATQDEIDSAVQDKFEELIMQNCSWDYSEED